ncbi:hypothetical protein N7492_001857 [Penicillium capsulatum]|uniref:Alpha/beta hydrolase fold-3 domain-containing protein n=1 Tax=Penicillium capsulatum TaxID=69766 RepID=A0A9W9LZU2_9EURO|nr:hypothetical protein N7492_001857 [Penicillium capsulatum]KAJ6129094.1 hypothetical protein N7512_001874 [Penicillium capsulatum]
MADFSEYTGPSADWIALEPSLPKAPDLPLDQLIQFVNKDREERAAETMVSSGYNSKVEIQDHTVSARDGSTLEARTYRPVGISPSQPLPVYIHLHGGGYVFGTLASEDAICSQIVVSQVEKGTPFVVFNLNYRHTPVHRFPAAWDDVEDAFIWVHEHIREIGGIGDQVVIGGISAGAQLTAALTLAQLHDKNKKLAAYPKIRGQVLMIPPVVQMKHYAPRQEMLRSPELSSLVQCAEAPLLPISRIQLFTKLLEIPGEDGGHRNLRTNPGNATAEEVKDLPPTTFGIAGNDPLRDEALFYAKLLSENGVPTDVHVFRGVPHAFRRFGDKLSASEYWDRVMNDGIPWALSNPAAGPFEIKSD